MAKKDALISIREDYQRHEVERVEFHWTTGGKAGIGNKEACTAIMNATLDELQRQIDECDGIKRETPITISQECYDNIMKAFSLLMEEAQYVVNGEAMTDCDRTYCQEGLQYSEAALKELNKYKKQ